MAKTLHYDFLTNPTLTGSEHPVATSPTLSITRATKATVVKSDGLIHEVSAGVARFTGATYSGDTASGTSTKGLLVEEARTNICLQSEDFATTWTNFQSVESTNQTIAPDGSLTADKITDDSGGGSNQVAMAQNVTVSTATQYTYSVFAKKDQVDFLQLRMLNFTTPSGAPAAWFDLTNGTVGTVQAGIDGSGIEDYGNGWYRCWIVFTTDAADTTGTLWVQVGEADNIPNVARDGTSSIYVWGAQLEAGAFPTSYIPTTTASVTRNADDVSGSDTTWQTAGVGTFYIHFTNGPSAKTDSATRYIMKGQSTGERIAYKTNSFFGAYDGANSLQVLGGIDPSVEYKYALGYADADPTYDAYINGAQSVEGGETYTDGGLDITSFDVGSNGGLLSSSICGHIAEIAYFNERLANATLEDYSLNGLPTAFPGTVAGDGGHIWPARSNDPRWAQIITDSGITPSGNFIDDVHAALEAMASDTGAMDDLWKKVKAIYSITDTSEPFTY